MRIAAGGKRSGAGIERLLPIACIAGAALLIASEFMTTFRLDAAGETTLRLSEAADRHNYAMLVIGLFAIGAVVLAVYAGSKPAAIAVAVAGGVALLVFLLADLPDAGKVGTIDDPNQPFLPAEAKPEGGFWVELIGSLVLAVCGAALATLSSAQLRALGGRFSRDEPGPPSPRPRGGGGKSDLSADTAGDAAAPASTNSHPPTERAKSKPGQDAAV